ncbi:hypothetical protein CYMTET_26909 [Cymbomonas tetramitiformis]|uniref:Uncharacterized protein n=1 Tax=Cymbomonas tetramitiformis TaxID=36881 RepID=A0AAE0KXI8_9CHLO|nr:hypothetical protein CYMTET_26909 [Cymbomonas tetramitiformis]
MEPPGSCVPDTLFQNLEGLEHLMLPASNLSHSASNTAPSLAIAQPSAHNSAHRKRIIHWTILEDLFLATFSKVTAKKWSDVFVLADQFPVFARNKRSQQSLRQRWRKIEHTERIQSLALELVDLYIHRCCLEGKTWTQTAAYLQEVQQGSWSAELCQQRRVEILQLYPELRLPENAPTFDLPGGPHHVPPAQGAVLEPEQLLHPAAPPSVPWAPAVPLCTQTPMLAPCPEEHPLGASTRVSPPAGGVWPEESGAKLVAGAIPSNHSKLPDETPVLPPQDLPDVQSQPWAVKLEQKPSLDGMPLSVKLESDLAVDELPTQPPLLETPVELPDSPKPAADLPAGADLLRHVGFLGVPPDDVKGMKLEDKAAVAAEVGETTTQPVQQLGADVKGSPERAERVAPQGEIKPGLKMAAEPLGIEGVSALRELAEVEAQQQVPQTGKDMTQASAAPMQAAQEQCQAPAPTVQATNWPLFAQTSNAQEEAARAPEAQPAASRRRKVTVAKRNASADKVALTGSDSVAASAAAPKTAKKKEGGADARGVQEPASPCLLAALKKALPAAESLSAPEPPPPPEEAFTGGVQGKLPPSLVTPAAGGVAALRAPRPALNATAAGKHSGRPTRPLIPARPAVDAAPIEIVDLAEDSDEEAPRGAASMPSHLIAEGGVPAHAARGAAAAAPRGSSGVHTWRESRKVGAALSEQQEKPPMWTVPQTRDAKVRWSLINGIGGRGGLGEVLHDVEGLVVEPLPGAPGPLTGRGKNTLRSLAPFVVDWRVAHYSHVGAWAEQYPQCWSLGRWKGPLFVVGLEDNQHAGGNHDQPAKLWDAWVHMMETRQLLAVLKPKQYKQGLHRHLLLFPYGSVVAELLSRSPDTAAPAIGSGREVYGMLLVSTSDTPPLPIIALDLEFEAEGTTRREPLDAVALDVTATKDQMWRADDPVNLHTMAEPTTRTAKEPSGIDVPRKHTRGVGRGFSETRRKMVARNVEGVSAEDPRRDPRMVARNVEGASAAEDPRRYVRDVRGRWRQRTPGEDPRMVAHNVEGASAAEDPRMVARNVGGTWTTVMPETQHALNPPGAHERVPHDSRPGRKYTIRLTGLPVAATIEDVAAHLKQACSCKAPSFLRSLAAFTIVLSKRFAVTAKVELPEFMSRSVMGRLDDWLNDSDFRGVCRIRSELIRSNVEERKQPHDHHDAGGIEGRGGAHGHAKGRGDSSISTGDDHADAAARNSFAATTKRSGSRNKMDDDSRCHKRSRPDAHNSSRTQSAKHERACATAPHEHPQGLNVSRSRERDAEQSAWRYQVGGCDESRRREREDGSSINVTYTREEEGGSRSRDGSYLARSNRDADGSRLASSSRASDDRPRRSDKCSALDRPFHSHLSRNNNSSPTRENTFGSSGSRKRQHPEAGLEGQQQPRPSSFERAMPSEDFLPAASVESVPITTKSRLPLHSSSNISSRNQLRPANKFKRASLLASTSLFPQLPPLPVAEETTHMTTKPQGGS